jgi:glycosyltransferase involved in cell wall biosynthesis
MYNLINIIIPVYNEGQGICAILQEIEDKVHTPHRIYIIYDTEEDNTLPVVKNFMKKIENLHLVKNKYGKGALSAIKTGFNVADGEIMVVVMADLSDDISKIDAMFKKIQEGADIVCGSRYMKGGRQIGGPKFKKLLSKIAGISLHYLVRMPTHDITNSFKMYTKKVLNTITIESNGGFELGMEIVIKAFLKGYTITEVPSAWCDRNTGKSRFKLWKWLPKYIYWYCFVIKNKITHHIHT